MEKGKLRNIFERIEIEPSPELESAIFIGLKARKRRKRFLWFLTLPLAGGLIGLMLFMQNSVTEVPDNKRAMALISKVEKAEAGMRKSTEGGMPFENYHHAENKDSDAAEQLQKSPAPASGNFPKEVKTISLPKDLPSKKSGLPEKRGPRFAKATLATLLPPRQFETQGKTKTGTGETSQLVLSEKNRDEAVHPDEITNKSSEHVLALGKNIRQTDSTENKKPINQAADTVKAVLNTEKSGTADSSERHRKKNVHFEISLQAGYAVLRQTDRYATQTDIPASASSKRNGVYGSQVLMGIQGWILNDKPVSFYLNCEAGIFSDYFRNIRYQLIPGNFDTRLENNVLILNPRNQKIEEQIIIKNLLMNAGVGLRYRFAGFTELRAGASLRTSPYSSVVANENGKTSRRNPGMKSTFGIEAGLSAPLRNLPEKWGKFRLEIFYLQENKPVWQLSGRDRTGYGFAGLKLSRQLGD
jgi:hypothetical protein